MRVLFTTQPASGHLHPLVPLARALDDAGHAVAVCSAPSFRSEVEAFGLVHIDAGLDWLASDRSTWGTFPPLPPPGPEFIKFGVATWADVTARAMIPDLLAIAREWEPDLIVREGMEYGGCVAAECLGIPHASVAINTYGALDSPDVHHIAGNRLLVGAALSRHREEHGLPPDPDVRMPFRHLHLCFTPPRWDGDGAARPANTRFVRHTSTEWPGAPPLDWLGGLPDRPTVLASLGTVFNKTPGVLEAIIAGLGGETVNVIVAIGPGQDPTRFGRTPANVRLEAYVPQARLLAHCDLFITHGGFNSVKQALSEGVPMVIVPISADQPYSAERCVALGVAEAIDPGARSPNAIRAVARKVLGHASYRASARRFQAEMAALPDSKEVVKLLQALGGRTVANSVPATATPQQRPRRLVAPRSGETLSPQGSEVHQPHGDQRTEASRW